jgi:hypothetical protein
MRVIAASIGPGIDQRQCRIARNRTAARIGKSIDLDGVERMFYPAPCGSAE